MTRILFSFPPDQPLTVSLSAKLDAAAGTFAARRFADGESYVRVISPVKGAEVFVLAALKNPDEKILSLLFLAHALREQGAQHVVLIAPYLPYMRQDAVFKPGEVVTAPLFAKMLSQSFDGLVTVDPHLHRILSLDAIYSIPTRVVHANALLADWLKAYSERLLLVGPDVESTQWVEKIAARSGHPYVVLKKVRYGDRQVEIELPSLEKYLGYRIVLIDDMIATAHTLIQAIQKLKEKGFAEFVCLAVHGLFVGTAYRDLLAQGVREIVTTNSIAHETNELDLADLIAAQVEDFSIM